MIAGLIILLFLGGGEYWLLDDIELYMDRSKTVVTDTDRRQKVKVVLNSIEESTEKRNGIADDFLGQIEDMAKEFNPASLEREAVWNTYMTGIEAHHRELLELRFELKQHVTRGEWQAIFAANP